MNAGNLARFVLRVAVAGLMLPHGISKIVHGVDGISAKLIAHGIPGFVAYGVIVGEVIAPLLILVGWMTRPAAWVLAFNMVVAVLLVHPGDLLKLGKAGGYALEVQALYFAGAVAVALLGAGKLSARRGAGAWD